MTRYLLDTNIVSFYVKQAFPALTFRMQTVPGRQLFLSAVNEAELRFSLAFLPIHARAALATVELLHSITVEPWDSRCAVQYAALSANLKRTGRFLATADAMIAAHALALDAIRVTNDAAFLHSGHVAKRRAGCSRPEAIRASFDVKKGMSAPARCQPRTMRLFSLSAPFFITPLWISLGFSP